MDKQKLIDVLTMCDHVLYSIGKGAVHRVELGYDDLLEVAKNAYVHCLIAPEMYVELLTVLEPIIYQLLSAKEIRLLKNDERIKKWR